MTLMPITPHSPKPNLGIHGYSNGNGPEDDADRSEKGGIPPLPATAVGMRVAQATKPYLPVTAGIIEDLVQQRFNAEQLARELETEVKTEKKFVADRKQADLDILTQQRNTTQSKVELLEKKEVALRQRLQEEASSADRAMQRAREHLLRVVETELAEKKSELAGLRKRIEATTAVMVEAIQKQGAEAAKAFAQASYRWGVDDPFQALRRTPAMIAAENGMVLSPLDAGPIPDKVAWGVTVVSGTAAGVSLGLAAHFLHADTLGREVVLAAVCALFGLATSTALKYGLESLWGEVSIRLHSAKPWRASALLATLVSGLIIIIFSMVERRGLMAGMLIEIITQNVRAHTAVDATPVQVAALFGSLFLTVPYSLLVSAVGYRKARHTVVENRAQALLSREQEAAERKLRNSEPVKAALAEGALLQNLEDRLTSYEADCKMRIESLLVDISILETRRDSLLREPSTPASWLQLRDEQEWLSAQRQHLESEAKSLETRKQELSSRAAEMTPAGVKKKAAEEQARVAAARVSYEEQQARRQIEIVNGGLWRRLRAAVSKKPTIGTLQYQVDHTRPVI